MARRRGKVRKEPLLLGGNLGLEQLRTGWGRREAAPKAGQQETLPPPSLQEHKSALFGAGILLLALLSPAGALGFKDAVASPGPVPGQGPSEPLVGGWGQRGQCSLGWL